MAPLAPAYVVYDTGGKLGWGFRICNGTIVSDNCWIPSTALLMAVRIGYIIIALHICAIIEWIF